MYIQKSTILEEMERDFQKFIQKYSQFENPIQRVFEVAKDKMPQGQYAKGLVDVFLSAIQKQKKPLSNLEKGF